MTNQNHGMVKEQLLHLLFGTIIFLALGGIAISLDLAAAAVKLLGVSSFTSSAIELTVHGMFVLDLLLFVLHLARTSWTLCKEYFK